MSMNVFSLKAVLGLDSSKYEQGLEDAKGKASSIGSSIGKGLATIGRATVAAVGAATSAVGVFTKSSLDAGMSFDKAMSQVQATMLKSNEDMAKSVGSAVLTTSEGVKEFSGNLREFAQFLGQNTAYSATQAAEALNYMALAGYTTQESMNMLPNVLSLAAAGNFDLARASDMVTDAQTAFGIEAERTTQMVDEMAKTASISNTSVEQLGDAFLVVGGLAQELNGGFINLEDGSRVAYDNIQELEIALGAMANAGIKGGEAGTHLRNMLLKLASPTDDGYKAFTALGVSVFDADGKMRSLAGIMEDLDAGLSELSQEEKLQAISDIFNTRDTAAAEALLNAVGEDWASIGEGILNAKGSAAEMANIQLDNLSGDITLFQSALEGAKIAISDVLTAEGDAEKGLRSFVRFGTDGLSTLTSAFKEGGLTGAMEAFGTILSEGLAMVLKQLPSFVNAGMQLLGALGQGILNNLPIVMNAAIQIANQLAEGLIVAIPALLDGAEQLLIGLTNGIAQVAPTLIPQIAEMIVNMLVDTIYNVPLMIEAAINLIQSLVDGLINAIPILVDAMPVLIQGIINGLITAAPLLINGTIKLVQGLVKALPTIISVVIDAIPTIISLFVNGLLSALPALIQGQIQLMLALVAALPQIIQVLTEAIPTIIQTITDALIANLPQLINGLIQMTIALASALPQIVGALIKAIPQIMTMVINAITTSAPMIWNAVVSILGTIGLSLLEYGSIFVENVGEVMSNILNTVVEWLSQLPTQMAYWAGFAIGSLLKFFMELPGNLVIWFTETIQKVIEFGIEFKTFAANIGRDFFNNLIDNIKQLPARLKNLALSLVSAIASLPSKFAEIGRNAIMGLWNGIQEKWQWLKDKVSELASSLLQGAKDALGIQSPSKKFAWIGRMVDEGFAKGINNFAYLVNDAIGNISDELLSFSPQLAFADSTSTTPAAGYNQIVNIYSPTALTPSEVARQTRNATRDMVLNLRGKR